MWMSSQCRMEKCAFATSITIRQDTNSNSKGHGMKLGWQRQQQHVSHTGCGMPGQLM